MKRMNTNEAGSPPDRLEEFAPKHSRALTKELRKGKNRRLGFVETFSLKCSGRADGRIGLPKMTDSGEWSSAFLIRETNSYAEYCDRLWGNQQIELHWAHARCDELFDEILKLRERLGEVKRDTDTGLDAQAYTRRRGEEDLSESQVQARRSREAAKEAARHSASILQVEERLDERVRELSQLHSFIMESDNAARLICDRVMNHTRQRIDVYWRAAYRVHPDSLKMPAAIHPLCPSDAEQTYMSKHFLKDMSIAELLARYEQQDSENKEAM